MSRIEKKIAKNLLKQHETAPQKKLGQNFLVDKGAISRVLEAADVKKNDIVLEIGPGTGNLTQELVKLAGKVVAIEKDMEMVKILKENMGEYGNLEILQADARNFKPETSSLESRSYKVVANIPFYLTAYLIRSFLEAENPPKDMTLIIQKEVAKRICAKPPDMTHSTSSGSSRAGRGMNILAVSVQFYAEPKIISYIPKTSFWPQPKVDGAIIKIIPHKAAPHQCFRHDAGLREQFFKIVRSGFRQPRKQLLNNLSNGLKLSRDEARKWLLENDIQPARRAETLNIEDWIKLANVFNQK